MSNQGRLSLSTKDVVVVENFQGSATLFQEHSILRIKDLVAKLEAVCKQSGKMSADEITLLFGNGVDCEVLQPGSTDWQNGTMHLSLEFQPVAVPVANSAAPELAATATIAAAAVPAVGIAAAAVSAPSDAVVEAAQLDDAAVEAPIAEAPIAEVPVAAVALELDAEPVVMADISELDFAGLADESNAPEAVLDAFNLDAGAGEIDVLLGESEAPVEIDAFADVSGFGESLLSDADLAAELEVASGRDLGDLGLESAVAADPLADLDVDLMADLDSTAAPDLDALNSPWDLTGDLDAMLLKNGHM
jgi:KGK domain